MSSLEFVLPGSASHLCQLTRKPILTLAWNKWLNHRDLCGPLVNFVQQHCHLQPKRGIVMLSVAKSSGDDCWKRRGEGTLVVSGGCGVSIEAVIVRHERASIM